MDIFGKQSWLVILAVAFALVIKRTHSAESNGQKAHFQVEDKSGDLKITATKDLAKVTAQADSVQVVVKPGMAEYPVMKSDKPIVHVVNGWNTMSFRKSSIPEKRREQSNRGNKKSQTRDEHMKRNSKSRTDSTRKNSFVSARKLSGSRSKMNRNSQQLKSLRKAHRIDLHKGKKGDIQGSKKSNFETGFRVSGTAGKLKMDVTRNETQVLSESGTVDVFLKQKPKPESSSDVGAVGRNADQILQAAPKWHVISDIGLRKSNVPVKSRGRIDK